MSAYRSIPKHLHAQREAIAPSYCGRVPYYPCELLLDTGDRISRAYVMSYDDYMPQWGVRPEDDSGKKSIEVERVVEISESKFRLPAHLATELYEAGESGMGYFVFTVEFKDRSERTYCTGGAVDFITPPAGLRASDAVRIKWNSAPHSHVRGPDYVWCLYGGIGVET